MPYLRSWKHVTKGSPVKPALQPQIGLRLITSHRALMPQIPGHGSTHLRFLHARFTGQSELTVHSARQFGGVPMNVGKQEQIAWPFNSRH